MNQKGFIQIPLLIIVIASIIVASAGTGVVLHKQGKLSSITANISQMFKGAEETVTTEEEEIELKEPQIEEESEVSQEEVFPSQQELEQARLEAEKAKQEAKEAKAEAERLRKEMEETQKPDEPVMPEEAVESVMPEEAVEPEEFEDFQEEQEEIDEKIEGTEVWGIISSNTTWSQEKSPYIVTDTVQIPTDVTLTIEPGVTVVKPTSGDMFLLSNGKIYARGLNDERITFDGGGNSSFFKVSGYGQAFLDMEYSIVKNGLMFWPGGNRSGHFRVRNSDFINLSEISTLWFPSGDVDIGYNKFINTNGFRIYIDKETKVYIENNLFNKGNSISDTGYWNFYMLISSLDSSEIVIRYNSFIDVNDIVLKLCDSSDNTFSASNNYWGTQDKNIVESMIYDRDDDIRCVGYINYLPILTEPHPNTPKL